jgi:hypothetical protein
MSALTELKIRSYNDFRADLISLKKAELTPTLISNLFDNHRGKLRAAGNVDLFGRYILSISNVDDVEALDAARDEIVRMVDVSLTALSGEPVRPILDDLILKVKDTKLSALLKEFNAIKDQQPNLAAIGLRTIFCLIIQERAKNTDPTSKLAARQDLALDPMLGDAVSAGIFPQGQTKLIVLIVDLCHFTTAARCRCTSCGRG